MLTTLGKTALPSLRKSVQRLLVLEKHTLPALPYDFGELEPTISAEIMELHHTKHHQTYVNNLNVAEEQLAEAQEKGMLVNHRLLITLLFFMNVHLTFSILVTWLSLGNIGPLFDFDPNINLILVTSMGP